MKKIKRSFLGLMFVLILSSTLALSQENFQTALYSGKISVARKIISSGAYSDADKKLYEAIASEWESDLYTDKAPSILKAEYDAVAKLYEAQKVENAEYALALVYRAKKEHDSGDDMEASKSFKKAGDVLAKLEEQGKITDTFIFASGVYHYFAGQIPSGLKWIANLAGIKANPELGLQRLESASRHSWALTNEAKNLLIYAYGHKEGRLLSAMKIAKDLHTRYPQNPAFLFSYGEMQLKQKNYEDAQQNLKKLETFCQKNTCSKKYKFFAVYHLAEVAGSLKQSEEQKAYVLKALELDTKRYKKRTTRLKKWQEELF